MPLSLRAAARWKVRSSHRFVIPAQAGIRGQAMQRLPWTPAFAGVTRFRAARRALSFPEAVEGDDFGGRSLRGLGGGWGGYRRRHSCRLGGLLFRHRKFERKIDRRVGKAADRGKGNRQAFELLLETEGDREALLADLEVPELVLEHDRHFLGIALAQAVRNRDARRPGGEADIEMVCSAQTLAPGPL